jgi:hypothetical protein
VLRSKKIEKFLRKDQAAQQDFFEEQEGVLYGPGIAD